MSGGAIGGQSRDGALTNHGLKWSPEEEATLRDLRIAHGWSCAAIGQAMGRSVDSVHRKCERLGIPKPPHRRNVLRETIMREAFAAGASSKRVARQLGVSPTLVREAFARYGEELTANATVLVIGSYIGSREMAQIVAPICGVTVKAIYSPSRYRPCVLARMAIARALRDRGLSMPVIARGIGRSDHSTVFNLLAQFDRYCRAYPQLATAYEAIKQAERVAAERRAA